MFAPTILYLLFIIDPHMCLCGIKNKKKNIKN